MSIHNVNFYNISDDPRVLYKTTGDALVSPSSVTPYQPVDYVNPKLILGYNEAIHGCNYCAIQWQNDTFVRYYYIRDVELANGEKMIVHLDEDVLMTYANQIAQLPGYAIRTAQENRVSEFIYDPLAPCEVQGWISSFYPINTIDYTLTPPKPQKFILLTAG